MHSFCSHFAWVFYCMLFFFSCLFFLFLFVEEKPYCAYVMLHVCSYSTKKLNFYVYVSSLREHLQFNFHSSVFIDHIVWYVPCMVRFVIKRGPFCP